MSGNRLNYLLRSSEPYWHSSTFFHLCEIGNSLKTFEVKFEHYSKTEVERFHANEILQALARIQELERFQWLDDSVVEYEDLFGKMDESGWYYFQPGAIRDRSEW